MRRNFDYNDILKQVLDFLAKLGIEPYSQSDIVLDGEMHRFRTNEDKPSEKSGAILIHADGWPAGYVQDWRKGIKENWKYDISGLDDEQKKYFNSEEYRKKCDEKERKAREKREAKQLKASEAACRLWKRLDFAPEQHPYSVRKHIPCFTEECLRYNPKTKCLAVPLKDINGQFQSIQWIPEEGHKSFFTDAPIDGAFWSVWLENLDKADSGVILLGEGFATMAKVFELTKKPCVAAMSCYSLEKAARQLREKYPEAKIIITADNDWETERKHNRNPGLLYANIVVNTSVLGVKLADGVVSPEFTEEEYIGLQGLIQHRQEELENTEVRYTLTEDEYNALQYIPTEEEYTGLQGLIQHRQEELENTEVRYTLSEDEYNKLQAIFEAVYPDENSEPVFVDEDAISDLADASIQTSIDDGTFDDVIDERIRLSEALNEDAINELIDTRIQQYLIKELIDARIQEYLSKEVH